MSLPTGSALGRGMECPASCVLARAGHTGEAAVSGQKSHQDIEEGDTSRPVVRRILEGATDVRHEVAYALNVETRTVREVGVSIGRAYGQLDPAEIAMTVDIECFRDGVLWVGDWKSRGRVAAAASNWQIRAAVIATTARHAVDRAVGFLAYLDDGEVDEAEFDCFHVSAWWDELADLLRRVREMAAKVDRGETPNVNAGTWCQYCPALPHCPAHTRLALSMLGELDEVGKAVDALTVEQCGRAWELLKRYDVVADRVRETIRARARRELIPLSNGRRLALVDCSRRSFDQKRAIELLEAAGVEPPYKSTAYSQVKETKVATSDE